MNLGQIFPDNIIRGDKIESLNVGKLRAGSLQVDDYIQSTGFVTGTTGWQIKGDGNAEFVGITLSGGTLKFGKTSFTDSTNAGYILNSSGVYVGSASDATYLKYTLATGALAIKGAITADSGTIGSFTIGTYLYTGTKTAYNDANAGVHLGSDGIGIGNNVFTVSALGALVATSATITGAITATSGSFTGTINATAGKFGTSTNYWSVGATGLTATSASTDVIINYGKTDFDNTQTGFILGYDYSASLPKFYIGTSTAYLNFTGAGFVLRGATVDYPTLTNLVAGSEIAIQGWQNTCIFSATNYRVVAWTVGTITLLDGTTYAISAGNTGNISALNYIYLDIAVSTTVLQKTTTAATAVGTGKILVAVAQNNSDTTSKATFQVFGGSGGQMITVDSIAANSASVNEFISNTAQIKDAIITNAKITALDVGKLTAGTITSKAITLAVAGGTGDTYIASGKSDFTNVDSGFILGIDDSDGDKSKFFIGNSTNYLNWDGAILTIAGTILNLDTSTGVVSGIFKTTYLFTTGEDIASGDAVCVGGLTGTKLTVTGASTGARRFGTTGAIYDMKTAQSFSALTGKINEIKIYIEKIGAPTDNAVITLVADNAGKPTGATLLTFPVIAGGDLTTSFEQHTFTVNAGSDVTGATVWLVFSRSGALSNTNYYAVKSGADAYAGGTVSGTRDDITWTNVADDLHMVINYSPTSGYVYKASALEAVTTTNFIGFAKETKTAGNSCKIQISDIFDTTGLTTGSIYYLSNTYGAIATSAGTVTKKVGLAISTTELNILNTI